MTEEEGDFAVRSLKNTGNWKEMTYAGALSFSYEDVILAT